MTLLLIIISVIVFSMEKPKSLVLDQNDSNRKLSKIKILKAYHVIYYTGKLFQSSLVTINFNPTTKSTKYMMI